MTSKEKVNFREQFHNEKCSKCYYENLCNGTQTDSIWEWLETKLTEQKEKMIKVVKKYEIYIQHGAYEELLNNLKEV